MKFYAKGNLTVWDKEFDKALCHFKNGIFETKEKRIIEKLMGLGYKYELVAEKVEDISLKVLTVAELKKLAKSKGIKGADKMNKAELMEVTR